MLDQPENKKKPKISNMSNCPTHVTCTGAHVTCTSAIHLLPILLVLIKAVFKSSNLFSQKAFRDKEVMFNLLLSNYLIKKEGRTLYFLQVLSPVSFFAASVLKPSLNLKYIVELATTVSWRGNYS